MLNAVLRYISERLPLGEPLSASRVPGGLMHKMYRLETTRGTFALKLLSPEVMSRPGAASNFDRAESLEDALAGAGVPASCALAFDGRKRLDAGGQFFYIFDWIDGMAVGWDALTASHASAAGSILGRIHGIERRCGVPAVVCVSVDWDTLAARARTRAPKVAEAIAQNAKLLYSAADEYNASVRRLPRILTITDGDMDAKNVIWTPSGPVIIDLECLRYGSPFYDAWVLALSWAGGDVCEFDGERFHAFLDAYERACGLYPDAGSCFGLGFSWLEWLEYNVRRACGEISADPEEAALGLRESVATVERVQFYSENRDAILRAAER